MILLNGTDTKSSRFPLKSRFPAWARYGTHFLGSKTRLILKMLIMGGPKTPWKSSWRVLEHQNCGKTVVSAAYDDLLGFSPPPNFQKVGSKLVHAAARTATCSIFDTKMVPKWRQRAANTARITFWFTLSSIASNNPLVYLPHGVR